MLVDVLTAIVASWPGSRLFQVPGGHVIFIYLFLDWFLFYFILFVLLDAIIHISLLLWDLDGCVLACHVKKKIFHQLFWFVMIEEMQYVCLG